MTTDRGMIDRVEAEFLRQKASLPRLATVDRVMEHGLFLIFAPTIDEAAKIASRYAPEHLEIQTAEPAAVAEKITAAGAIFLGKWTPEPVGDFCAGPSHVLPTASSARFFNGLETVSFCRRTSIVEYSEEAIRDCGAFRRDGRACRPRPRGLDPSRRSGEEVTPVPSAD